MIVGTSNIKDNPDMPDAQVRSDIRHIMGWKRFTAVGWQEINDVADDDAIDAAFKQSIWWHLFRAREYAVSIRKTWAIVEKYYRATHDGLAGVTPNRGYVVAIIQNKLTRKKLAFVNTHFVSGAWYGEHTHQAWRQEHWNIHFEKMRTEIQGLNAKGLTVIVVGDFNRHKSDIPRFTNSTYWAIGHGYDHIIICPAANGAKLSVKEKGAYIGDLHTDHKPLYARIAVS